jgi:hypothetical protein
MTTQRRPSVPGPSLTATLKPPIVNPSAALNRRQLLAGLAAAGSILLPSRADEAAAASSALHAEGYGLDKVPREVPRKGRLVCPKVSTAIYRGKHIRYAKPARIYTGFRNRLIQMEQLLLRAAMQSYGRAPNRLHHLGTYNCRRIGGYPNLISEHGLGNAIDISGFDFPALPKTSALPRGLPKQLARPFRVRLLRHFSAQQGIAKHHANFLHRFSRMLIARPDIFRVMLGPGYPGHKDHFHFDCATYRLVQIF